MLYYITVIVYQEGMDKRRYKAFMIQHVTSSFTADQLESSLSSQWLALCIHAEGMVPLRKPVITFVFRWKYATRM